MSKSILFDFPMYNYSFHLTGLACTDACELREVTIGKDRFCVVALR